MSDLPSREPPSVRRDSLPWVLPVAEELPAAPPGDPLRGGAGPLAVIPADAPAASFRIWSFPAAAWRRTASACEWLFGAATLLVGLAVLAAIPILGFLSLGYLLEAGGRVARTGRLRAGFVGVRRAARLGGLVLGIWLMLLPLRLVSSLHTSAQLIEPNGSVAHKWRLGLTVLTTVMVLHIAVACSRGGRLRHFLWPFGNPFWLIRRLRQGGYYQEARDAVWDFVTALRLPHYFRLGLFGFAGAFAWLAPPITLLALGVWQALPLVGVLGSLWLALVLLYVPFLQIHFAATGRFRAFFECQVVRARYRRAPWAFSFALFATLLFALPLYLLKIELIPREAAWLPSLVFVFFIYPAKLLTGWAYSRAERQRAPRHWFFAWTGRFPMVPVALFYVLVVFFTQYTAWNGVWSLYEQHAFLLPVPFDEFAHLWRLLE